jgi:hypothetical protein
MCCCCKRGKQGLRGRLLCAGIFALCAFFSPFWIFALHSATTMTPASMNATVTQISSLGVIYPYEQTVTNFARGGVPQGEVTTTRTHHYASKQSAFCEEYRRGELPKSAAACKPAARRHLPSTLAEDRCMALVKICGSQFRAAAAFSFLQGASALVGAFLAPGPRAGGAHGGARKTMFFAVASAASGVIAVGIVSGTLANVRGLVQPVADPNHNPETQVVNVPGVPSIGFLCCLCSLLCAAVAAYRAHSAAAGGFAQQQAPLLAPAGFAQPQPHFQQQQPPQQQRVASAPPMAAPMALQAAPQYVMAAPMASALPVGDERGCGGCGIAITSQFCPNCGQQNK